MAFVVGEQTSRTQWKSLWTETRNLKIQNGEDVDVLRRPELERQTIKENSLKRSRMNINKIQEFTEEYIVDSTPKVCFQIKV